MGRLALIELEGVTFNCRHCNTQLAKVTDLVHEDRRHSHQNNYLMTNVVNVFFDDKSPRTIMGTQAYIYCVGCCARVGWRCEDLEDCHYLSYWAHWSGKYMLQRFEVTPPPDYVRLW